MEERLANRKIHAKTALQFRELLRGSLPKPFRPSICVARINFIYILWSRLRSRRISIN